MRKLTAEYITDLIDATRDCSDEDWEHNRVRFIEILEEYKQTVVKNLTISDVITLFPPEKFYKALEQTDKNIRKFNPKSHNRK